MMTLHWRSIVLVLFLAALICLRNTGAYCEEQKSTLDTFEDDVTKTTQDADHQSGDENDDDSTDVNDENLSAQFMGMLKLTRVMVVAGKASWLRVTDPQACRAAGVAPRRVGDPLLPFARLDLGARPIEDDLHAIDLRAEVGIGPLGVQYDETNYEERDPADTLKIRQYYGLYRMSGSPTCEVDLGVGQMVLDGNAHTSKAAFTLPILFYPKHTQLGIEFRPAWADRLSDYDIALLYSGRYSALKAGYRWVESPNCSLSGPYMGISVRL